MFTELNSSPFIPTLYGKALLSAINLGKSNNDLPQVNLKLCDIKPSRAKIRRYAHICGYTDLDYLPVTYPHILSFPLQLEMLTHRGFPYPLLGLVHVRNAITQYRKIRSVENLSLTCEFGDKLETTKGVEFDIVTRCHVQNELVWESASTNLYRQTNQKEQVKKAPPKKLAPLEHKVLLNAKSNIGRQYGSVSGDLNPIHLFNLTAKLFGFDRAIAHGMWTKARCLAELEMELPQVPFNVTVDFKLPVLLPAKILMLYTKSDNQIQFDARNEIGDKPHLTGLIQAI